MAPDVHGKINLDSTNALLFWVSLFIVLYTYAGYPALLAIWAKLSTKTVLKGDAKPFVSLIISVYNEERVIREKLENSLKSNYPADKLEIIVASDSSTDQTHGIVSEFKDRGVKLHIQEGRLGKTATLNSVVPLTKGEVIFFTDANSMLDSNAINFIVENFSDPEVGCATGETKLVNPEDSATGENEKAYYSYDTFMKINESAIGSTVGADGAIFAIRKKLYKPLGRAIINDFVIPLQVVSTGYRVVYEPRSFLHEPTATPLKGGFNRRVRIINRSLWGLASVPQVLNPFKAGFFTLEVISRKLLRWTAPLFIIMVFMTNLMLIDKPFYLAIFCLQSIFYIMAGLTALQILQSDNRFINFPYYFCHGNAAALVALIKFIKGERIVTWDPIRR